MKHFGKATKIVAGLLITLSCVGTSFASYNSQSDVIENALTNLLDRKDHETQIYIFDRLEEFLPVKFAQINRKDIENCVTDFPVDENLCNKLARQQKLITDILKTTQKLKSKYLSYDEIHKGVRLCLPDEDYCFVLPKIFKDAEIRKITGQAGMKKIAKYEIFYNSVLNDGSVKENLLFQINKFKKDSSDTDELFKWLDLGLDFSGVDEENLDDRIAKRELLNMGNKYRYTLDTIYSLNMSSDIENPLHRKYYYAIEKFMDYSDTPIYSYFNWNTRWVSDKTKLVSEGV